jgi:hypothetical protein
VRQRTCSARLLALAIERKYYVTIPDEAVGKNVFSSVAPWPPIKRAPASLIYGARTSRLAEQIESELAVTARDLSGELERFAGVVRLSVGEGAALPAAFRRDHPQPCAKVIVIGCRAGGCPLEWLPSRETSALCFPSTETALTSSRPGIADRPYLLQRAIAEGGRHELELEMGTHGVGRDLRVRGRLSRARARVRPEERSAA